MEAHFGDATDPEFLADIPLGGARWVVSTVPQHVAGLSQENTNVTILQLARSSGYRGRIAVASHVTREENTLMAAGATVVLEPFQDAADRAVELLCGAGDPERTNFPEINTEGSQLI